MSRRSSCHLRRYKEYYIIYDISETIIMMSIQILLIITINTIIIQYILLDHNHDGIYL